MRAVIVTSCACAFAIVAVASCTNDFGQFQPTGDGGGAEAATDAGGDARVDASPPLDAPVETSSESGTPTCTDTGAILFANRCYFALGVLRSWDASRTQCAARNAHLAVINGPDVETAVQPLLTTRDVWIGLHSPNGATTEASYVWITGETRTYSHWAPGEPAGTGPCVRMLSTGQWADQLCATTLGALCERD